MNNFRSMGVINITPDSFSDGNLYNSRDSLYNKLKSSLDEFDIIDLGAESTAPFNEPIDKKEELKRFDLFLSLLADIPDPNKTISIDTYKCDVFRFLYEEIKKSWPNSKIIFNDVSGAIDNELTDLLNSSLDFEYVFSHNLAPKRLVTSHHMQYCLDNDQDIVMHLDEYFKKAQDQLSKYNNKIIFDPCFGFSKTREQNHRVLKNLIEISSLREQRLLIGISRKSFLRFPPKLDMSLSSNKFKLDHIQTLILKDLACCLENELIFRVHDSSSIKAIKDFSKFML